MPGGGCHLVGRALARRASLEMTKVRMVSKGVARGRLEAVVALRGQNCKNGLMSGGMNHPGGRRFGFSPRHVLEVEHMPCGDGIEGGTLVQIVGRVEAAILDACAGSCALKQTSIVQRLWYQSRMVRA